MNDSSWRPSASLEILHRRAEFIEAIRRFFRDKGVLEVDTPLLASSTALDPYLDSIQAHYHEAPGVSPRVLYLQTSPEYAMKRLLAAGSGPIFQLGRAFRDSERGRRHNPEFTMLEWYRPGFDLEALMSEVAELVQAVAKVSVTEWLTYREAFQRHADVDPFIAEERELQALAGELSGLEVGNLERDELLDIILSHQVEPCLGQAGGTFIYHYPPSQAALAQTCQSGDVLVAQRFELYVQGIELANGYFELTDADEQVRRFDLDNLQRRRMGKPEIPIDQRFIAALRQGMPSCSGVALGVDRLLMIAVGAQSIDEVIPFPIDRI